MGTATFYNNPGEGTGDDCPIPLEFLQNLHFRKPEPQKERLTKLVALSIHHDFDETHSRLVKRVYLEQMHIGSIYEKFYNLFLSFVKAFFVLLEKESFVVLANSFYLNCVNYYNSFLAGFIGNTILKGGIYFFLG